MATAGPSGRLDPPTESAAASRRRGSPTDSARVRSGPGSSSDPSEFFIVGCPRSGTTLLRFMLDAHPEIAVTPETHFGERFTRPRRGMWASAGVDAAANAPTDRVDRFCASEAFRRMEIDDGVVRAAAAAHPDEDWRPMRAALHAFARRRGVGFVGEKTPSHALYMRELSDAFPSARFFCLQRDPRAVVTSWHRTTWSTASTIDVVEKWMRHRRAMQDARRVLPGRCLEIRYEELVRSPEAVLASVCQFLELPFDSRMLAPRAGMTPVADDSLPPDEGIDNVETFSPPDPSRIDAWRHEAARSEIRLIESLCARAMREEGYISETSIRERLAPAVVAWPRLWRRRARRALRNMREVS